MDEQQAQQPWMRKPAQQGQPPPQRPQQQQQQQYPPQQQPQQRQQYPPQQYPQQPPPQMPPQGRPMGGPPGGPPGFLTAPVQSSKPKKLPSQKKKTLLRVLLGLLIVSTVAALGSFIYYVVKFVFV